MGCWPECVYQLRHHRAVENLIPAQVLTRAERKRDVARSARLQNSAEFPGGGEEPRIVALGALLVRRIEQRIIQSDMLDRGDAEDDVEGLVIEERFPQISINIGNAAIPLAVFLRGQGHDGEVA